MSHRSDQQANSCPAAAAPGQEQENQKPQRISSKMKTRIVQRLMRGESLEPLAREFGTSVAKISQWRDEFLQTGEKAMKKDRGSDEKDRKIAPLEQKLGETTMDFELLQDKVKRLEQKRPLARRKSKK